MLAHLYQCYSDLIGILGIDWTGLHYSHPCMGNWIQISVQVCWRAAIVSCGWPAKDRGPEPRYRWFPIRCDKQYCNNSSRGNLKWHQRGPVLLWTVRGRKHTGRYLALHQATLRANYNTWSPHLSLPLTGWKRPLIGHCYQTHLHLGHMEPKWLTAVNFAHLPTVNTVLQHVNLISLSCARCLICRLGTTLATSDPCALYPCWAMYYSLADIAWVIHGGTHIYIKSYFLQVAHLSLSESASSGHLCRASGRVRGRQSCVFDQTHTHTQRHRHIEF